MTFKTTKAILFAALVLTTIIVSGINPVNAEQSDKKTPTKVVVLGKIMLLKGKGNMTVEKLPSSAPHSVKPLIYNGVSNSFQIQDSCVNGAPLYTMSYSGYYYTPTQSYYLTWDFPSQVASGSGLGCTTTPYSGNIYLKVGDGSNPQNWCWTQAAEPHTITSPVKFTCTAFTTAATDSLEIQILGLYGTGGSYQGYGFDDWYVAQ
jgi:hypothetical protein